jgi:hypothetical protein
MAATMVTMLNMQQLTAVHPPIMPASTATAAGSQLGLLMLRLLNAVSCRSCCSSVVLMRPTPAGASWTSLTLNSHRTLELLRPASTAANMPGLERQRRLGQHATMQLTSPGSKSHTSQQDSPMLSSCSAAAAALLETAAARRQLAASKS